jgi:NAD-dependent SIR2 family protein deacetylase
MPITVYLQSACTHTVHISYARLLLLLLLLHHRRGVPVVEINLEPTDNSRVCKMSIQGRAGELLPELLGVADDPAVAAAVAQQRSSGSGSK